MKMQFHENNNWAHKCQRAIAQVPLSLSITAGWSELMPYAIVAITFSPLNDITKLKIDICHRSRETKINHFKFGRD